QIQGIIEVFAPEPTKTKIVEIPTAASFTSFVMDIDNAREDLGYEPEFTYIKYLEDYKKEQELKRFDAIFANRTN
ncbi:MAG: NAD(P)-dependent oxidoreductase, partial [Oscillospiraceae bacterium]|nr:NAD(P)-dependent oxidoreductase [Oscillospiraceae bacterium]